MLVAYSHVRVHVRAYVLVSICKRMVVRLSSYVKRMVVRRGSSLHACASPSRSARIFVWHIASDGAYLLPHLPPRLLQLLPQEPCSCGLKGIEALWVKRHSALGHDWRREGSELLTKAEQKGTADASNNAFFK